MEYTVTILLLHNWFKEVSIFDFENNKQRWKEYTKIVYGRYVNIRGTFEESFWFCLILENEINLPLWFSPGQMLQKSLEYLKKYGKQQKKNLHCKLGQQIWKMIASNGFQEISLHTNTIERRFNSLYKLLYSIFYFTR